MRALIRKSIDRIVRWHDCYLSNIDIIHIAAVGIGLLCGAGAALLKGGIDFVSRVIFSTFNMHSGNWVFFILPITGIFIAVLVQKYLTKQPMDHASDRVAADMAADKVALSPKLILGPIIGCSLTLGTGGSAGGEDPICYTGAAIGSNVGKAFRLTEQDVSNLVGIGAAAGIAGIFMAPIGGVVFALEVLKMKQSLRTILAMILSSLFAALTCYILLGCHTDVTFVPEMRFELDRIPLVLLCGVACGIYSVYYGFVTAKSRKLFARINNIWLKALTGGLILASLLFFFPCLYGEGYNTISKLMVDDPITIVNYGPLYKAGLHYDLLLALMGVLLLAKPLATSSTNDSGGVGGGFTPTFFAGGVAGFLFAAFANHFCGTELPVALFSYFGMAAVMAGAVRAPLMAIFISSEITGLYGFILPLTLSAIASFITATVIRNLMRTDKVQSPPESSPAQSSPAQSPPAP